MSDPNRRRYHQRIDRCVDSFSNKMVRFACCVCVDHRFCLPLSLRLLSCLLFVEMSSPHLPFPLFTSLLTITHPMLRVFSVALPQIHFMLLVSRQGKVRLTKWWSTFTNKEKNRYVREVTNMVLNRAPRLCNFLEWKKYKIVYKR